MENEYQSSSPLKSGVKWGVYLGIVGVIFSLIQHYAVGPPSMDGSGADIKAQLLVTLINYVVLAVFFYLGIKHFKERNAGLLSVGEGITTAMSIGLVSGVIMALFSYIYFGYLAPEVADQMIDSMTQNAEANGAENEDMSGIMSTMLSPGVAAITTFFSRIAAALVFGLIISLILKNDD